MGEPECGIRRRGPEALTEEAWAPFGWLPVEDTDPRDGIHRLAYEWEDPHVNIIGHARSEVPAFPGGLLCEMLYRHSTHTQVIMPLDHRCVIAVAPKGLGFDDPEDADLVGVFGIEPLQALVLDRGTWHWGPYPVRTETVSLFNIQGLRYAEDNEMMDLAGRDMAIEVLLS
ncbi:MAG TPA: ureidoglycolate lyase [Acidimicrobiales bacterium]